jgi:hypothetical protein
MSTAEVSPGVATSADVRWPSGSGVDRAPGSVPSAAGPAAATSGAAGIWRARQVIYAAVLDGRLELDLSGLGLTVVPEELGQLTHLQRLDLSRNQLTTLPAWIGQLADLQDLNLSDNQLTELPTGLGQLTNP